MENHDTSYIFWNGGEARRAYDAEQLLVLQNSRFASAAQTSAPQRPAGCTFESLI
jgi:hypothetical protein